MYKCQKGIVNKKKTHINWTGNEKSCEATSALCEIFAKDFKKEVLRNCVRNEK